LQFFSGSRKESFNYFFAPDGDISGLDWSKNQLLKLRKTANDAIKIQIVKLDADIQSLDTEIAQT